MLASFALIFIFGLGLAQIASKLKLPRIVGMIAAGILIGPFALDLIDGSVLGISAELREIALVVILLRAGLSLDPSDLNKVGRPALLMSFVPASFEILGYCLVAPRIFGISFIDAAVMGAVLSAVSPAVVVPRMISLTEKGLGTQKRIPQMIMAGASCDDVFVIVLFMSFTDIARIGRTKITDICEIPVSIVLGMVPGAVGVILAALIFRAVGVLVCLIGTKLSFKERLFCVIAYIPKATVQAAIGSIPLAMGLDCGEIVLSVASDRAARGDGNRPVFRKAARRKKVITLTLLLPMLATA